LKICPRLNLQDKWRWGFPGRRVALTWHNPAALSSAGPNHDLVKRPSGRAAGGGKEGRCLVLRGKPELTSTRGDRFRRNRVRVWVLGFPQNKDAKGRHRVPSGDAGLQLSGRCCDFGREGEEHEGLCELFASGLNFLFAIDSHGRWGDRAINS
jgi:hypothetical protein